MNIKLEKNKQYFIMLFLSIIVLFSITYGKNKTQEIKRINNLSEVNLINEENISPKELFNESWQIIKFNYYNRINKQAWNKWKKRYSGKIKTEEDAYVAINSMLASLNDSYSRFMSKEEFSEQNSAINSKLYGIGINIASISGKTYVINVLEGTPAHSAGIRPGDIILKINDIDINGKSIYQVAQLIRGEISTSLNMLLLKGSNKYSVSLKRAEIKIKTIDYKKLNENIGYIRISSFIGIDTPTEFVVALNRLKETKGLILDLRGNAGGLFQNAVVIANLFMDKGTIVQVVARQEKKNIYDIQNSDCIYTNPLVVLIDENSASASEILASALRDNNRATLVGTKTYGKGLVQKIFSLPNETGMNLTIAKYLTPKGIDINKKGVSPDYDINFTHADFINNIDPQLSFAKDILQKKITY